MSDEERSRCSVRRSRWYTVCVSRHRLMDYYYGLLVSRAVLPQEVNAVPKLQCLLEDVTRDAGIDIQ